MKNKEKQIEEMMKDICRLSKMPSPMIEGLGEWSDTISEYLINVGYRKINENEVVISNEEKQKLLKEMYEQGKFDAIADLEKDGKVVVSKREHQKYLAYKIIEPQIKGCLDRERALEKQLETTRKETAEKILNKLWNEKLETEVTISKYCSKEDAENIAKSIISSIRNAIKDLAKEFGVDLGE